MEAELTKSLMEGLVQGHQEKSYPYVTLTPDHAGHHRNWQRPLSREYMEKIGRNEGQLGQSRDARMNHFARAYR